MAFDFTRRHFFFGSLLAGAVPVGGFGSTPSLKTLGYKSPNEKLNIASIGAGGKAASDIAGCAPTENIVALCDVDDVRSKAVMDRYPKLPKYKDFRKMLDKEGAGIDAVIIAIPDQMHATAAMHCMVRGKHVYTQKPLCRTIWEARQLQETAAKYKVATQMGNQGYSNEGTRQCAEMIWAGEIGDIKEVHAWTDRPWWPQGVTQIPAAEPVPSTLDWDMWLGMAEPRDWTSGGAAYLHNQYGHFYQPFNWRGFFDFGCGALGDMACHILGAPNLALRLSHPTSVEVIHQEGTSPIQYPKASVIKYEFPARGDMPPVNLFWHDGLKEQPKIAGVPEDEYLGDLPRIQEPGQPANRGRRAPHYYDGYIGSIFKWNDAYLPTAERKKVSPDGSVFIGDKGIITTGTYGEDTRLIPVEKMRDYHFPPPLLTRSPGHYRDWIRACKGGDPACSNFNVAVPFVEWMLLGVVALRAGTKIEYDPEKMKITNNADADKFLKPYIRKGWSFAG